MWDFCDFFYQQDGNVEEFDDCAEETEIETLAEWAVCDTQSCY